VSGENKMNAYERAIKYFDKTDCYKREEYRKIDKLIEPLCNLLNHNGYITLHSCSAHIEEEKKSIQWYILFVATKPISTIRKIVNKINKKYNYKIIVYDDRRSGKKVGGLTRRWSIQYMLWDLNTKNELIEINENIYKEFKELL
jgi:hypothetical protein